jgi:uncharacterized membrane protein YoaK (UPF0700 family)
VPGVTSDPVAARWTNDAGTQPEQSAGAARRDRLLVALTVSSGAVDAISFLALGKVFTAFMTGNLVFLAMGVTGAGGPAVLPVGVSLVAFSAGVLAARRVLGDSKGAGAWPAAVSLVLGLAAVSQLGFLLLWISVSGRPAAGGEIDVLVGLSALAMGLQSGAVRALGVTGVFTTAATATVIVLMTDLAARSAASERMRLAGVIAGLLAGAAAGSLLLVHARSLAAALPPVVTMLVIAAAASGHPNGQRRTGSETTRVRCPGRSY